MKNKAKDKIWYPNTIAICIGVILFVSLTNIGTILNFVMTFVGYFKPVIIGFVIAYMMNPVAKWFERNLFKKVKKEKVKWILSVLFAVLTTIAFLAFLLGTLIPQVIDSVVRFVANMDSYSSSLVDLLNKFDHGNKIDSDKLVGFLKSNETVIGFVKENAGNIISFSAGAGKIILNIAIAFILSIYILLAKESIKKGSSLFLEVLMPDKAYEKTMKLLSHFDNILSRYIVYSIIDACIIGVVNAVFMAIFRMEYIGLISLVVAVCNLFPTFGPLVGGILGGFILLLVNPVAALFFVTFTIILQAFDAYIIKPKLFSNSLGVSGLLILISVIVCGNIFGVIGILASIPLAAGLQFVFLDEIMPALKRRKEVRCKYE